MMIDYEFETFNPVTAWHEEKIVVKKIFKKTQAAAVVQ
jgi:hypothetical protein